MLKLKIGNPLRSKVDAILIPVCENRELYSDNEIKKLITEAKKFNEFSGEAEDELIFYNPEGVNAKRIVFLGIGKVGDVSDEDLRNTSASFIKTCISKKLKKAAITLPDEGSLKLKNKDVFKSLVEGAFLANSLYDKFLTEKKKKPLEAIEICTNSKHEGVDNEVLSDILSVCNGTLLAREWVSDPSNIKTPDQFIETLASVYKNTDIEFSYLEKKELQDLGCGLLLAVAQGSDSPPYLAFADYKPESYEKTIVLVGKGVTFDSGGIDIKPAAGMVGMKSDMAGAAAVSATMVSIASLKPDVRVIGVMPIVENMPSGHAYRPGDIFTSYSGKTVEIGNTDAEGRLILADALSYAEETYKPDAIIDIATLTGACLIALGDKIAGVFSFNDRMASKLVNCGDKTGERCWQLPMPTDYKKLLKSEFADLSNMSSTRFGGSITAALFLSEFIKTKQWAHVDIAGPAFMSKAENYSTAGGTGFGVRLLCEYIATL